MRNLTLILCGIALVGAIASGVLFFIIGNSKQELHQKWQQTESKLGATQAELADTQREATALQDRNRVLDTDLAAAKRDLTEIRFSVEQLQQAYDLAEESRLVAIAARETAIDSLTAAHTELDALRAQLATSIAPVEAQRYRRTIADLESRGTERLATVEISQVAEHYSIAQVLAESLSGNLRKGDAAALTP